MGEARLATSAIALLMVAVGQVLGQTIQQHIISYSQSSTNNTQPEMYAHCKASGDINGDGRVDIVVGGATGKGHAAGGIWWWEQPPTWNGTWQRRMISAPNTMTPDSWTTSAAVADIDGDGDLDLFIPRDTNSDSVGDFCHWFKNPGSGWSNTTQWTRYSVGSGGAHDVAAGDFDGDGNIDFAIHGPTLFLALYEVSIWFNNGGNPPTWTRVLLVPAGSWDGREGLATCGAATGTPQIYDIATGRYLFVNPRHSGGNTRTDTWGRTTIDSALLNSTQWSVHCADMDGDLDSDIIVTESETSPSTVRIYLRPEEGAPWPSAITLPAQMPLLGRLHGVKTLDADGDGDLDLVVAEMEQQSAAPRVILFRQTGTWPNPTWSPQLAPTPTAGSHNMQVVQNAGPVIWFGVNHGNSTMNDNWRRLFIWRW